MNLFPLYDQIKFSVLMSLYIKETLDNFIASYKSILENTIQPNQVVIVFDGPVQKDIEDFLNEEIENGSPVTILKIPNNVGLGNALNFGLRQCQHEWVFRMDTDDICLPDRFKTQIDYIKSNPNTVVVGGHIAEFDSLMINPIGLRKVPLLNKDIIKHAKFRSPFNHMTVAFKKSVIFSVGGYQHHHLMEDYNLWLRIIAKGFEVGNIDEVLVNVRAGREMLQRRRGVSYIKSEWYLMLLKYKLSYQSLFSAFIVFVLRSFPRLLCGNMQRIIYRWLRK